MTSHLSREILGQLMRDLRTASGRPLSEVARAIGCSRSHLSNVERGRDAPNAAIVTYYDLTFHGDGQVWDAWVEVTCGPRPFQRRQRISTAEYPVPGDAAAFVGDVTVPDGEVLLPRTPFTKIWRIRNTGTVPWIDRRYARQGPAGGIGVPTSAPWTLLPDTMPGEEVDLVVPLVSGRLEGTTQARWKMTDAAGWTCFPHEHPEGVMLLVVTREDAPAYAERRLLPPMPS